MQTTITVATAKKNAGFGITKRPKFSRLGAEPVINFEIGKVDQPDKEKKWPS
jgi:hypothetical protein